MTTARIRVGAVRGLKDDAERIDAICKLVTDATGNVFGGRNRSMVENRVASRMLELGIESIHAYWAYLEAHRLEETEQLISRLTTHHTYFFREYAHFELLETVHLPRALAVLKSEGRTHLRVWSAACSRGQEVYSLAMSLRYALARLGSTVTFEIVGTDVDPISVDYARNGVYPWKELKEAPRHYLGDLWARGTGEIASFVKAKRELKASLKFAAFNLVKPAATQNVPEVAGLFDIVFCRNVFIYFAPKELRIAVEQLLSRLHPEGSLFVGVSESLNTSGLSLASLGPSIYGHPKRAAAAVANVSTRTPAPSTSNSPPIPAASAAPRSKLRILCVDDSPSVLKVLARCLTAELGFEVVGTAANGREAIAQLSSLKPDAITLDIHMPEMTGVDFLRSVPPAARPPVIMVSSVSRDDGGLAAESFRLGASDFVEKPTLARIQEMGDELRAKLRAAVHARSVATKADTGGSTALERSFQAEWSDADLSTQVLGAVIALSDIPRLKGVLGEFARIHRRTERRPRLRIWVTVGSDALATLTPQLTSELVSVWGTSGGIELLPAVGDAAGGPAPKRQVVLLFSRPTDAQLAHVLKLAPGDWFATESDPRLGRSLKDVGPETSFAYLALRTLAQ